MSKIAAKVQKKLKPLKALVMDCDGILTDGQVWQGENGEWIRAYSILDGMGLKLLLKNDFILGVITGSKGKDIKDRCNHLGVQHLYQGIEDKKPVFDNFLKQTNLKASEVAYIGDDFPDIPVLKEVGFSASVPHAFANVLKHVDYVTKREGGYGAVRELCDLILQHSAHCQQKNNIKNKKQKE